MTSLLSDRDRAVSELEASREAFRGAVDSLPDEAWSRRASAGGWTVLEVVEHVAVVEHGTMRLLTERLPAGEPAPARTADEIAAHDARIARQVLDRSVRIEAPERIRPRARWGTAAEALAAFVASREQLVELVRALDERELRAHVVPHPIFGAIDGVQWIRAAAGHTMRHVAQIAEILETRPPTPE
jgi:hypothetical protein